MKPSSVQEIKNGNDNIQAGGDVVTINHNYFGDYKPSVIRFYEKDICMVIEAFNTYVEELDGISDVDDTNEEFQMVGKPEKNRLNNLSEEYFQVICDEYLQYFKKIHEFLLAPQNKIYLKKYRKTARELNFKIIVLRKHYDYFEDILNKILIDVLESENVSIIENRDVFIVFLNFMYWNCDIGRRK